MRKTVPFLAAWFVAGIAAVAIAGAGVSAVSRQVTGNRPAPLNAEQVRDELAARDGTSDVESTGDTSTTGPTTTTTAGGADGPVTTDAPGGGPAPTSPGGPAGGPTTTAPTPPPVTTAPGETRSYPLIGGTATLRFTPSGVAVLTATPKAGFEVELSDTHGSGVRVEFRSDDHRSRVDACWDGGPQDEVREED